jgi:ArsR family transcriptional regulator
MNQNHQSEIEKMFLALSDGTRLRLLYLMNGREVSVGYLSDELSQSQPKISRHLAYLRNAGLVRTRRDSKWIYYSIEWPKGSAAAGVLRCAMDWIGGKNEDESPRRTSGFYSAPQTFGPVNTDVYEEANRSDDEAACNDIEIYLL